MKKDRENPSVEALALFFLAKKQLSACQEKKGDLEGLDRNEIVNSGLYWNFFQCLQTANWNWELLRDILRQMLQQANVICKVVAWWFRGWTDCDKLDKHEATTPLEENIDGK